MRHILACALALGFAAPALAAEPFNGPFVGAELGWQQDRLATARFGLPGDVTTFSFHARGLRYGGFAGYDLRFGGMAGGIEVGVSDSTASFRNDGASFAHSGRSLEASARVGAVIGGSALLYLRGGYSNWRVSPPRGFNVGVAGNRDGWLIGGGGETMLTDRISARLEYRFSRHKDLVGEEGGVSYDLRPRRHAVTAGVALRF